MHLTTVWPEMITLDLITEEFVGAKGADLEVERIRQAGEFAIHNQMLNSYVQARLNSMDKFFVWRK
jgi:hypothetical protein